MLQMKLLCSPPKNESDCRFDFNSGALALINFGEFWLSSVSPVCRSSIHSILRPMYSFFLLLLFSFVQSLDLPCSTAALCTLSLLPFQTLAFLRPSLCLAHRVFLLFLSVVSCLSLFMSVSLALSLHHF